MKNVLIITLLLSGSILFSCTKQKLTHVGINSAMVKAFNYKVGSYWIYKDSLTGEIDSFYVTSNTSGNDGNKMGYSYDFIQILLSECPVSPISIPLKIHHWGYVYEAEDFCFFDYDYYSPNDLIHILTFGPLVNYPYENQPAKTNVSFDGDLSATGFAIETFSSYTFESTSYNNVAKINWDAVYSETVHDCFYMSPDIGFFKMTINQSRDSLHHIWEIQRYNIVH